MDQIARVLVGVVVNGGAIGLALLSLYAMHQINPPEKSQRDESLDEPTQRTRRAAVVISAPPRHISRLEPQGCTRFINLNLGKKESGTWANEKLDGIRMSASYCSLLCGDCFFLKCLSAFPLS